MVIDLQKTFGHVKPLIGMLHLAGEGLGEKQDKMFEDMGNLLAGGLDGVIVEDYHGDGNDVVRALALTCDGSGIARGVNFLQNPYDSFRLANLYGAGFVQFDNVNSPVLKLDRYMAERKKYPGINVLGGVRFKYQPETGRSLEQDILEGMERCDVIVTTGDGTGLETPITKIRAFKKIMGDFPLFVGAGLTRENAREQLSIANGAIVGSYVKREYPTQPRANTRMPVRRDRCEELVLERDAAVRYG
ncbi:MAG: BtpA/SgcQ family protein [archaeon]